MKKFVIQPLDTNLKPQIQQKIDNKTKPVGALGVLEDIARQICLIQNTLIPRLNNPHIIVFAGDHGIVHEGVSAYPQEVTYQMVMNFVSGGAGINVFCKQNQIRIKVVDAGVNFDFSKSLNIIHAKIAHGTKSFLKEKAMTIGECEMAIDGGAQIVTDVFNQGCNIIGFGDMGIGNTSSASMLMSQFCQMPIEECVGRGAGLNDEQYEHKLDVLKQAIAYHKVNSDPLEILSTFGGFEITMMCGAMLQAAEHKMILLIDGFIATSAFLAAYAIDARVKDYALFCHQSDEQGHERMLQFLKACPILHLNMRLGEGTGVAIAYPIIQAAVNFLNDMASFESAGVSKQ